MHFQIHCLRKSLSPIEKSTMTTGGWIEAVQHYHCIITARIVHSLSSLPVFQSTQRLTRS